MMCDLVKRAPYQFLPIEAVELGIGSWELGAGKGGEGVYRCKG